MITVQFKVRGVDLAALEAAADAQLLALGGSPWTYNMEVDAVRFGPPDVINEWQADVTATLTEGS